MGAQDIIDIIDDNYGSTGSGGDTPSVIGMANFGQGDYFRFEYTDESIIVQPPSKDYVGQGVEQFYEKDTEIFEIQIATVDSTGRTRYDIIERELRRIFLAFEGNFIYSRLHLDRMNEEQNSHYTLGTGLIAGYLNLSHART